MAWKGKAIGAALGALVGGPVGGAVGSVLGHCFDTPEVTTMPEADQWRFALMALFVSAAHANGQLHPKEHRRLIVVASQLFEGAKQHEVEAWVAQVENSPASLEECSEVVRALPNEIRLRVMADIFSILHADGEFDQAEFQWLDQLIILSGTDPSLWQYVLRFYQRVDEGLERDHHLQVLELSGQPSPEEIKAAYRRKCFDYHPDRLGNVPAHIRALAEDRLREINTAYDSLCAGPQWQGLIVGCPGTMLKGANMVGDGEVLRCLACEQMNRLGTVRQLLQARCGHCHALLAIPASLMPQNAG